MAAADPGGAIDLLIVGPTVVGGTGAPGRPAAAAFGGLPKASDAPAQL
jgi:hypothetical protein